jgi:hypothetical protein
MNLPMIMMGKVMRRRLEAIQKGSIYYEIE